jgi:outer membrane protein assembly factor BamD
MTIQRHTFLLLPVLLLVVVGCGNYRKIEKNPDWRVKYEAALNYYEKKDYFKASSLYEQILPIVRGLPEGEKVQFNLAYCQYHDKLYLLASEHFRTFYETYGRSTLVEEARFMYAYSLYVSSPDDNLDQTNSITAMAAMQEFLNRYPNSRFVEQAIESIQTTQQKLEKKGFANAYQYYKMRQYKAAIISFQNFSRNFPDSRYQEEAEFLILSAQFKLAEESFYYKQEERYREVVEMYKGFLDKYPKSERLREAERLYTESMEKLTRFRTNNS